MKNSGYTLSIYGLLVLVGGIIGFIKANSVPSLIAGSLFGAALIACGIASFKKNAASIYIGAGLTLLLTGFFAYRFLSSLRLMPAGIMTLLSLAALILLYFNHCCMGHCRATENTKKG
jgi:uncharacterized membrane protein (UPF0136 family)